MVLLNVIGFIHGVLMNIFETKKRDLRFSYCARFCYHIADNI